MTHQAYRSSPSGPPLLTNRWTLLVLGFALGITVASYARWTSSTPQLPADVDSATPAKLPTNSLQVGDVLPSPNVAGWLNSRGFNWQQSERLRVVDVWGDW